MDMYLLPKLPPGALCAEVDPELWFPDVGESARQAKALCQNCPILADCRNEILALERAGHRQPGVWAGMTRAERRQLIAGEHRQVS